MRFGAFVPQGWRLDLVGIEVEDHWPTMLEVGRRIEHLGFESLWVYDHFHTVPEATQEVTYEAWTLMAALAATTETVRLGQMCTCNTYRPPSYLAKASACIDVVSAGRVEMGIGAGWYEEEHDGYGYTFLSPAGRLGMLREGVEILKAMWTEEEVDYAGKHYQLEGGICQPKPVQEPHIPLWIAGGGEKVTLKIAAEHAAYTNFGVELDQFEHKSAVLDAHCRDLGTDFHGIVRSSNFNVFCAETDAEVEDKKRWLFDHLTRLVPTEKAESSVRNFDQMSGTPDQITQRLSEWEQAGMTYAIVYFGDAAYDPSSMELFAREVLPALS